MKKYYRVEQPLIKTKNSYDTDVDNYGNGYDTSEYQYFIQVYDRIMSQINLPVDFLISVTNQICMLGEVYMDVLKNAIDQNGLLHLYKVTQNPKHEGYTMPAQLINDFLQSFDEDNQFVMFLNGTVLWEYYLEKVRSAEFAHQPARLKSVFFFENVNDCGNYTQTHLSGMSKTFGIEILETSALFSGDMAIIDAIENSITRNELIDEIRRYWNADTTENPIMEVIFQGKYKLVEM